MFDSYTDVDILVNDKPIKKYAHSGRVFIQSNHQTQYSIRIKNNGWSRRLFVVSVDGINVVNGQAGGASKTGYVLNGQESMEIKGFRTDNATEHPFKFSSKKRSYAKKFQQTNGDTSNCGVIGLTVYDEFHPPVYRSFSAPKISWVAPQTDTPLYDLLGTTTCSSSLEPASTRSGTCAEGVYGAKGPSGPRGMSCSDTDNTRSFCASTTTDSAPDFDMGTEFSKEFVHSPVTTTSFTVGTLLTAVNIYYASREALIEAGVPVVKETKISSYPDAFPSQFCKPPSS